MKVVQIGVGGWGKNHSRILSEFGVLSAVCDANSERVEEFGKKYSVNSYSSFENLLDQEEFDAALVCTPTITHSDIATNVSGRYRKFVFITENIEFDKENFVFIKSAKNTAFEKSSTDKRYLHRDPAQNEFYLSWMNIDQGDEMIQVGYYNFWTFIKYLFPFFTK